MRRRASSLTYRLLIKGQLVQATLSPGIWRDLEKRAAKEGHPVEEVVSEHLEGVVPDQPSRR